MGDDDPLLWTMRLEYECTIKISEPRSQRRCRIGFSRSTEILFIVIQGNFVFGSSEQGELEDHMFVKQDKTKPLPHQLQLAALKVPPVHTLQQLQELDITLLLDNGLGAQGLPSDKISFDP
ncbi:hypothetical protein POM88_050616 [Heracleum sosnowskyi]|uniref:Uncharacterized protein n=1 Tax=Heracleum sosnowskyi TaxID=360622 RepID=A0AAD8M0K6_9APIA|nr:hypothetical protein POM88_050616 [Heracleum sosnowskyi]